jgi:hypothetical protein
VPLLQLSLVNACSSYENALKQFSVAIALGYKPRETKTYGRTVFLGSADLINAHKDARRNWEKSPTCAAFLRDYVYHDIAILETEVLVPTTADDAPDVEKVENAFLVRNDCIHNMGRSSKQLDLEGVSQFLGRPVSLSPAVIRGVCESMMRLVKPFDPGDRAWNALVF